MIELITGLPGNGKTLYTISRVRELAKQSNRAVYYAGIPELTLDWTLIEPEEWASVPAGAIVVIDECQKIFRNRSLGSKAPQYVTDLETHRHQGLDIFMITQHPSLIDPVVRRLAGSHRHLIRPFGMSVSTVHHWESVKDNCDKAPARADSNKTKWGFDKSVFGLYKSAEVHTVKRQLPFRVKMLLCLPIVLVGLAFLAKAYMDKVAGPVAVPHAAPGTHAAAPTAFPLGASAPFDPVADAKNYVEQRTPRVDGLAYTAPIYDEITKPVRAPIPAACIQSGRSGEKCKCFSQQGTPMDVRFNMCIEFARNGFFQEFDAEKDRASTERTAQSVRVLDGRGTEVAGPARALQVITFGNPPPEPPYVPQVSSGGKAG